MVASWNTTLVNLYTTMVSAHGGVNSSWCQHIVVSALHGVSTLRFPHVMVTIYYYEISLHIWIVCVRNILIDCLQVYNDFHNIYLLWINTTRGAHDATQSCLCRFWVKYIWNYYNWIARMRNMLLDLWTYHR